ncbi:unnamed protein product [Fusarium venenatum]|uniref:Uncharacterized protein n=1 Tax=Fusarium venenatum TaxID=56646 RepID=A0A2L2SWI8_9HYPO|nr:uncharacterized protein FVRRES_05335 [Fusarium venenatum]CEI60899.1 unnamed protein product [Fusarium venenatum]
MGPVGSKTDSKVSDEAGGLAYLIPNHNHLSRRGCPPLYVLAAGRLTDNAGEETYQHLIWASLKQLCLVVRLYSARLWRKEATKLLYKILAEVLASTVSAEMFSRPAAIENWASTAENSANIVIQLPGNNLDIEALFAEIAGIWLYGLVDLRLLCSGTRDLHPRPYFSLRGLGQIGNQGPDCGLAATFVGYSGEVVFDPSTPAVAVAETDQLDSVSFITPEGVEHNGDGVRKASLMVLRWSADDACQKWWC